MTWLIDADALKYEPLPKDERNYRTYNLDDAYEDGYDDAFENIRNAPTVDAVPVVKCKYCIYFDGYYCHNKNWGDGYGNYTPPIKSEDGFCDWAERKEE